ncbi:antibiotic biosynthesis monooxygenase family protein [Halomonas shantousis]
MTTANTPEPPYYAVIFSSHRTEGDHGYAAMAERMVALAATQPGFLGIESAREELGKRVGSGNGIQGEGLKPLPAARRARATPVIIPANHFPLMLRSCTYRTHDNSQHA